MQRIALLVEPGFSTFSFDALSVFELANLVRGDDHYGVAVLSPSGGDVVNSLGMRVRTGSIDDGPFDTVLVAAGHAVPSPSDPVLRFLSEADRHVRRLGSICLGAFALAAAGLLDGRRVTTHWAKAAELQERCPAARVEMDRVYICDGFIWSSGGVSTAIDMALGMVERDLGADLAMDVARAMVMSNRRDAGQPQRSALLELDAKSERIRSTLVYAKTHLHRDLSISELAQTAGLSARQFTRTFLNETGRTPAKAIESLRLEAAKFMLEQTRLPLEHVAARSGFGDRERMRRAFMRAFGKSPLAVRLNAGPVASF